MDAHQVYLGLGSNLGDRASHIARAVELIGELVGAVERQSALYETEPWGFESPHRFVNAVVCVSTSLSPRELLQVTQRIEHMMGRTHKSSAASGDPSAEAPVIVYHDRPIDIDILLYDDVVIDEPDLKIPHPLMQKRDFVMVPLNEILKK